MISKVREKLETLDYLIDEQNLTIDRIDGSTVLMKGSILFVNGFKLDFTEFKSPDNHDYRFHFMDENNQLVKRWDNSPHHDDVETFPDHVHTGNGVKCSEEKDLSEILDLVKELVLENI